MRMGAPDKQSAPRVPFPTPAELLNAALDYARRGWAVVPVHTPDRNGVCSCHKREWCRNPGKHPRTKNGFKDGTTDLDKIRKWWKKWPTANVGIATEASGLLILDVDAKHGGIETLAEQNKKHGPLPTTPTARSGGGGFHAYFRHPGGRIKSTSGILPGLDIRADGAQIVAPPSLHESGNRYRWETPPDAVELADAPAWLLELIEENAKAIRGNGAPVIEGEIRDGERNATLFSMAGSMRHRGMSEEAIRSALTVENKRCIPPMDETELYAIARGIQKYPAGENLTDLGNARRLVTLHGKDLRYVHPWKKWLVWDGKRWTTDATAEVVRRAKDAVRSIYGDAEAAEDSLRRKDVATHARRSEQKQRIDAMIALAASEPGIPVLPGALDRDPWLLNVENGTIDLKTGELREHRREDLLTKLVPVKYDMHAKAATFGRFLLEIMDGKAHLVEYLCRVFGYALTGDVREDALFFPHGGGRNGKTTLLNAIRETMGKDYATEAAPDLLLDKGRGNHPTELADLFGKRMVSTVEVEDGRRMAEVLVKRLTGRDPIKARRMREDFWMFNPTHKIFLAANHKPEIRGTDVAIWSRIHLIPFNVSFKGREDRGLPEKLSAERAGILAWLVRGCIEWQLPAGLDPPAEVLAATQKYREEMDVLGDFLAECCVTGKPNCQAKASAIYDEYTKWHKRTVGGDAVTATMFGLRLGEKGFTRKRDSSGVWWKGIGLQTEGRSAG